MEAIQKKLGNFVREKFGGEAVPHIMDSLPKNKAEYKDELTDMINAQLLAGWAVPDITSTTPVGGGIHEGWVWIWQLGYDDTSCVRERPKQVNVVETAVNFIDKNAFQSIRSPLSVAFDGAGEIAPFDLRHIVGMTRSLACKMVVQAITLLEPTEQEQCSSPRNKWF